jgi:hypothetical protein
MKKVRLIMELGAILILRIQRLRAAHFGFEFGVAVAS